MDTGIITPLLHEHESETLDFKREQYKFYNAINDEQSELLKDILAFANAWKRSDAWILIGVDEVPGSKANVLGIADHLKDNDLQQFVNSKTNKPVRFIAATIALEGKEVDVIKIEQSQDRPIYLKRDFGRLKKDLVYIRHGSSTDQAAPQEIAEMGAARSANAITIPAIDMTFANTVSRQQLGTEYETISVLLTDPPPPPAPKPRSHRDIDVFSYRDPLREFREIERRQAMENLDRLHTGPSEEQLRKYREVVSRVKPIGFWVHNAGIVTAPNVHIEIQGKLLDGLEIGDVYDMPHKPRGDFHLAAADIPVHCDVSVAEHGDNWVATISAGNLQPKAEYWTHQHLYIGGDKPLEIPVIARIFADNIPQPIEVPLKFRIKPEERVYRAVDFEKG